MVYYDYSEQKVVKTMHPLLQYPFQPDLILQKKRTIKRELLSGDTSAFTEKKIAVLGGSTTHDIIDILELFLLDCGIRPTFYESQFGQFYEDALYSDELPAFAPDLVFIHTSTRNLQQVPALDDKPEETERKLQDEYGRFEAVYDALRDRLSCPVIANNFEPPLYRLLGNRDAWDPHGMTHYIARLNLMLADYAASHTGFYLNDIAFLAADFGLSEWSDPFFWHMYKYCLCLRAIPAFSYNVSNIIKAIFGKRKKVLALDLDNTLWGGIVGDDGPEHLSIGHETSMGQVFSEFQSYCKALSSSGVLLAVDSKNDEENALLGLRHPEGTLRPEDFAAIRANWLPKDMNLKDIASTLKLFPDSFVFVDDNPAERAIVSAQLPSVTVPPLDAPEHYVTMLDRGGWFEVADLSGDDLSRASMYRANAERDSLQKAFANYDEYLQNLQMQAQISPFDPVYFERIAQLTNKSNQFNLTTKRFTEPEIEAAARNADMITLYGRLCDRFGDNGVVTVVIARCEGNCAHIDLWLMSCRVLKRNMEDAMLDALVAAARARGIKRLIGYYYKTPKNNMVSSFYENFGFVRIGGKEPDGIYELLTDTYENRNHVITVES